MRGRVTVADIDGAALSDPEVLALSRAVRLVEDPALSARFPAERLAQATVRLRDGSVRTSDVLPAHGGPESPLTAEELAAKFHELAGEALGPRAAAVAAGIRALHLGGDTSDLLDQLLRST